jgi:uncharacterized protein YndB with AHSA1/START domain
MVSARDGEMTETMEQQRSVDSSASPEAVWRIWSDPAHWPEWNPFVKSMELAGPFAIGTTAKMVTDRGAHQVTVTELEPGRGFALTGPMMPGAAMTFRCVIEPRDGGSRISQSVSLNGPLSGILFPLMGKQMADTFVPILQALAAKAEKG